MTQTYLDKNALPKADSALNGFVLSTTKALPGTTPSEIFPVTSSLSPCEIMIKQSVVGSGPIRIPGNSDSRRYLMKVVLPVEYWPTSKIIGFLILFFNSAFSNLTFLCCYKNFEKHFPWSQNQLHPVVVNENRGICTCLLTVSVCSYIIFSTLVTLCCTLRVAESNVIQKSISNALPRLLWVKKLENSPYSASSVSPFSNSFASPILYYIKSFVNEFSTNWMKMVILAWKWPIYLEKLGYISFLLDKVLTRVRK